MAPLSTYLLGDKGIASHPSARWDQALVLDVVYEGEADYGNLKCHRIKATTIIKKTNTPYCASEIWLAEARNFIPVREIAWTYRFSKDIPVGEGAVEDWREIKAGMWYPIKAHCIAYDKFLIQQQRKQKVLWRRDYATQEVSLDPKYDVAFFRDVAFPNGMAVYEVKAGKITRSYRIGTPATEGDITEGVCRRWWLAGTTTALVVLVGVFVMRRYRRYRIR